MFTKTISAVILATAAGLAAAAPTPEVPTTTTYQGPTFVNPIPVSSNIVTHRAVAGLAGLHFEPNNIHAEVGDVIEIKWLAKNHSIAQSSFNEPCKPLADAAGNQVGFFSGFHFPVDAPGVLNPNVFQFTVKDKKPIWFYCAQTTGNHCQNGMVGSVNAPTEGNTLQKFTDLAALTGVSIIPSYVQGGIEGPNPNPLSGFP